MPPPASAGQRLPGRAGRRARRRRHAAGRVPVHPRRHRTDRVELHLSCDPADPHVPSLAALSFPAGRFEREMRDLFGIVPDDHPMPSRLVRHFHWPRGWYPMLHGAGDPPPFGDVDGPYPFRTRRGPRGVRDPRRTGARRDDRAGSFPVLRRRRDHPEPEGPAVVRPPRHREALRGPHPGRRRSNWPNGSAETPPSGTRWRSARPSRTPTACRSTLPPDGSGRSCSNWNGSTTTSPTSARCATTSATAS